MKEMKVESSMTGMKEKKKCHIHSTSHERTFVFVREYVFISVLTDDILTS
jgi:hypothetical protein